MKSAQPRLARLSFALFGLLFASFAGHGGSTAHAASPKQARTGKPSTAAKGSNPAPAQVNSSDRGRSCHSDDPHHLCIAVKYVAFEDERHDPALTEEEALSNLKSATDIWAQCDIGFQLEQYVAVSPEDFRLRYRIANYPELDDIRAAFDEPNSLLIATTGAWNRSGQLGDSTANAWTSLPGEKPYGVVIEKPVATNAGLVAHELGHYLNLLHIPEPTSVMNATIYQRSRHLSQGECNTARGAVETYWSKMLR